MSREILFKAKRIDNGKWVEGFYQRRFDVFEKAEHLIFWSKNHYTWEYAKVDPATLCQYTGLTDKNGKKIWENDIVSKIDTNALGWHRERECKVFFAKTGYWAIETEFGDVYWIGEFDSEQIEVIGNIFDDPEFLRGEDDEQTD